MPTYRMFLDYLDNEPHYYCTSDIIFGNYQNELQKFVTVTDSLFQPLTTEEIKRREKNKEIQELKAEFDNFTRFLENRVY